ncbi:hypothetical protein MNBD_PLANCTO02-752 [hydrothermal vent metagenome]|uniref:GlcNAc-PI de-N-acetylase n=1 Tax=hydrothermal vent metagenome TaxID=652676 RepID=A0A3B1E191_9ZZZZ
MSQNTQQKSDHHLQKQSLEMPLTPFQYTRLSRGSKQRTTDLSELMGDEKIADQTWLFVSPHDDDLCLGAGLLMQAAVVSGVDVQTLIVTDGCLGYCTMDQREDIIDIRKQETFDSFRVLGINQDQVHYINYPDGGLLKYQGRRLAEKGEANIEGYVGLQNAFTYHLRRFRPTRVFVPTHTDLHPDHRYTYSELMISLFHASGAIWPELGAPLVEIPQVYELAVYCDFSTAPNIEVMGNQEVFDRKLKSVEAYKSQLQIAALVNSTRDAGPYEYLREINFKLYSPSNYRGLFE